MPSRFFRFGLPPHLGMLARSPERWERVKALVRGWLDPHVGRVTPVVGARYLGTAAALRAGHLDVAWLPPLVAHEVILTGQLTPLARCVRGGRKTNLSGLLCRAGDDLAGDLARGRWGLSDGAWVDPSSASGFLLPALELTQDGLVPVPTSTRRLRFLGPRGVTGAVASGEAAFGAAYLAPGTAVGDPSGDGLVVARVCRPVPSETLVVREGDRRLVDALDTFDAHPELQAMLGVDSWGSPEAAEDHLLGSLHEFSLMLDGRGGEASTPASAPKDRGAQAPPQAARPGITA